MTPKAEVDLKAKIVRLQNIILKDKKKLKLLQTALMDLVGVKTKEELDMMEASIRVFSAPEADKTVSLNAIDALRKTLVE